MIISNSRVFLSLLQSLRLSSKSRQTSTTGEIVNLMSVDAQRFMDMMPYVQVVWSGPYQIIVSLIFLYLVMGPSIFAGFALMVIMIPLSGVLAGFSRKLQAKMMGNKDSRIKMVNEVLNGIKVYYKSVVNMYKTVYLMAGK